MSYLWTEVPVFLLTVLVIAFVYWDICRLPRWAAEQAGYERRASLRADRAGEDQAWQDRDETLWALARLEVTRYEQRLVDDLHSVKV